MNLGSENKFRHREFSESGRFISAFDTWHIAMVGITLSARKKCI